MHKLFIEYPSLIKYNKIETQYPATAQRGMHLDDVDAKKHTNYKVNIWAQLTHSFPPWWSGSEAID